MRFWNAFLLFGVLSVGGWAMPTVARAHDGFGGWDFNGSVHRDDDRWEDRDGDRDNWEWRRPVDRYRGDYSYRAYDPSPSNGWYYHPGYSSDQHCAPRSYSRGGYWGGMGSSTYRYQRR